MAKIDVNDGIADDHKAMLSLLEQHGLLLDLPQATFDRCVGSKDKVNTICDQIDKRNKAVDAQDFAEGAVKNIRRLAELPGGRLRAMGMLINASTTYSDANERWNPGCDSPPWNGRGELGIMDELMTDLIRTHHVLLKRAKKEWKPVTLLKRLEEEGIVYSYGWGDHNTFDGSIELVRTVLAYRNAKVLAHKAVGHKLPPELVEMVRDCICSDETLLITRTQSTYPWWRDGRRW